MRLILRHLLGAFLLILPWLLRPGSSWRLMDRGLAGRLPTVHLTPQLPVLRDATTEELHQWRHYVNGTSPWFCLELCCWRWHAKHWPYSGAVSGKVTKEDLLSPINNRYLGDVVYGTKLTRPPGYELPAYKPEFTACVQPTTIIWVDTPDLPAFFANVWPDLNVPIVLATGDSDYGAPHSYLRYVGNEKLLHWAAMNCDLPASTTPKLTCLPLGVSQWFYRDIQDDAHRFLSAMERALDSGLGLHQGILPSVHHPKRKMLLVCFSVASNPRIREPVWNYTCRGPLRDVSTCPTSMDLDQMYRATAEHAFVLAPEGNGVDTYRTWEALYLGSYPIVFRNHLVSQYTGLPVLVIDRIEDLTLDLLEKTYAAFSARPWSYQRLYLGHYHELLGQFREGIVKEYGIEYATRDAP